ncbi:type II toxin-antitoxin system RnlB family antitoxin [Desulfuromonas sp. TF]|uniref:type II toxin-antitoxin system RnlB family antitoxin n=1 Tax=Desulfuromonas sp. TF TaxID=1232410 RepID=UPI0004896801
MSKAYNLKKISDPECKYIVFSIDYHRIEDYITDLAKELTSKSFSGLVIFDLLLSNGLSSDRYVKAHFDGNKFLLQTMQPLDKVDDKIVKLSSNFYIKKPEYLERSILSRTQKFLIRRELSTQ